MYRNYIMKVWYKILSSTYFLMLKWGWRDTLIRDTSIMYLILIFELLKIGLWGLGMELGSGKMRRAFCACESPLDKN